ncbi:hypothetical protein [Hymenobacter agri]
MMETEKILLEVLKKDNIELSSEFQSVKIIAQELELFLNQELIQKKIFITHKVGAKSSEIQDILIEKAKEMGFQSEVKGLFANYHTPALRPDYYKPLGDSKGIIMEVERGKTTINNMDLLDVWKCHICEKANYLFLIVPKSRQNNKGGKSQTFNLVKKRLSSFFRLENYLNVDAIFIFGY